MYLSRLRARCLLQVCYVAVCILIFRVHQHGGYPGLRNQLGQQLKHLGQQVDREKADTCEITARPGKAGNQAERDRITTDAEDDRHR